MRFKLDPFSPNGVSIITEITKIEQRGGHGYLQSNTIISGGTGSDPFITDGANGVTKIRWQSTPGAVLYDMTIDDTGHVVTTAITSAKTWNDLAATWNDTIALWNQT